MIWTSCDTFLVWYGVRRTGYPGEVFPVQMEGLATIFAATGVVDCAMHLRRWVVAGVATVAELAQHSGPNGLPDAGDERGARPAEDRGEIGQRERRAKDRRQAEHLDGLDGQGPELAEDQRSERGRKDERRQLGSAVPDLDRSFARQGGHELRHEERVACGALDRLEERQAGGCSYDFPGQGGDLICAHAPEEEVGTSLGHETSQQPVELRAGGRGPEGPNRASGTGPRRPAGGARPAKPVPRSGRRASAPQRRRVGSGAGSKSPPRLRYGPGHQRTP